MGLNLTLNQLAEIVACDAIYADIKVSGAVIDTRKIQAGDLFIALKGEHVDGHDYLAQAREAGAAAALVSEIQDDALPQLVVADVRKAFAHIARAWQQQCKARVVAITGSNGKTSVKEMVTTMLRQVGSVTATQGNLNNELGVPLTLSCLNQDDDFAVIEMGTNHHGEIAELVNIVVPDVAVINNIAAAHLAGFGSLEGVAKEKGAIYDGLAANGIAVVNADMPYQRLWQPLIGDRKTISFSLESEADIKADYIQLDPASSHFLVNIDDVSHHFNLPLPGMHNVNNSLAAIAVAVALDIPVDAMVKGLSLMRSVPHRLQVRQGVNDSRIIDDSYNANPGSYLQALNTLTAFQGEHWLVLGDFGELGIDNDNIHQQMGQQAREAGVSRLMTVGNSSKIAAHSFGDDAVHYEDLGVLQHTLQQELSKDVTCLIKGSRFMQLDKLADQLAQEGES
ncbi:UDP-N-acetylmuramoylalanyl-D-glutamyl-2,6-diaminopimelate--D-alanyl-D-alanine ligase [Methylophaga thiooxydans]|uniref:UDP-N-acetylmuramoyl-tripeptide--D-alanyl-D-alanine ligase n=1 Tax=Methylophaga thiooxydans TaxID=392484 RepID=A0A0A0BFI8_9GAMM|nr:UDP-N-acetylmuramoyl-tripeptide--D-alanyl-D-alanine ligase [Methylophaga thiooxydans]KGM06640.1 UDP-N-acetylmuramoylalanyl-D-glutamyl-2,6-diaminopimelate--D-alanyl-D-alanine ligase [Methylophaga thiooxydans]